MQHLGPRISRHGLTALGLDGVAVAHWNYAPEALVEEALRRREGHLAQGGPLVTRTVPHTGRSPDDKFTVEDALTRDAVHWGTVNRPFAPEAFEALWQRVTAHLTGAEVFVQDCHAGADPDHRLPVRVITETAWHSLFTCNMFITPPAEALADFAPGFTVLQAPSFQADPARDGTRSEAAIIVDFTRRRVLICGTAYAGEIKKSVFGVLNFLLPEQDVCPMHCSANVGRDGSTALFFGLSGTGKTTLSADASRALIGDDEHGWGPNGVFNFEGGCYAKVIRLDPVAEPEIHATTHQFGTLLENVVLDPETRALDLNDGRLTENTRASYALTQVPNAQPGGRGGHPRTVIMLTCDAFGVLPPLSRLTPEQAMAHFLLGYTARVAGTEQGVREPQATFSTCFGAPFMPRHPVVYAEILGRRLRDHGSQCWLVNTGWSGGPYGTGHRLSIAHTRALVHAALDGTLDTTPFTTEPAFGLAIPTACPGVPAEILSPRATWADGGAYDAKAAELAAMMHETFQQYAEHVPDAVRSAL